MAKLEKKVWKVYKFNVETFDSWMEELQTCIANREVAHGRYILANMWKLVIEMKGLAIHYPDGYDAFQAKYEDMREQIDDAIRPLEDDAFHVWHDFHYANYERTQKYTYAPYPYYAQPGREPQGDKPFSHDSPGPNYEP